MSKRAGIYVRVSSERQGEKVSPKSQEQDCLDLCKEKDYQVVDIFKDITRFKVGSKLVEPSGTRVDRPGFKSLIANIYNGNVDVVVAWKEDRLYRGLRPMLDFLDCIEETNIDVELVKEKFDKQMAPIKAWVAKMELANKHDRFMMGVEGRLNKGKAWTTCPPYGYERDGDYLVIYEPEAKWVRNLFEWYASGVKIPEIRQRFINGGAPYRKPDKVKRPWNKSRFYRILQYEPYWSGFSTVNWNGKKFQLPLEPIITQKLATKCIERRKRYRCYPAGNAKYPALAAGITYCKACGVRMINTNVSNGRTLDADGKIKLYSFYGCSVADKYDEEPGCAKKTSANKLDGYIWDKVWNLISQPGILEEALQMRIDELKSQEINAEDEFQKLSTRLDDLFMERQRVIGLARKKLITDDDLETQLLSITFEQNEIERSIEEVKLLLGNRAEKLEELGKLFREKVMLGMDEINSDLDNPEHKKKQFEFRKKIVDAIVERIDVLGDKTPEVHFVIDMDQLIVDESLVSISYQPSDSSILSKPRGGR